MATNFMLLGVFCLTIIGRCGLPGGSGVGEIAASRKAPRNDGDKVLNIARAEVGVREVGQNGGKRVSEYLAYTGIKVSAPYCASFVSWCFGQAGYKEPRTAWSPSLFPSGRLRAAAHPGLVFGIYFSGLKRIGHCGFVEVVRGEWIQTIEGNTNVGGCRVVPPRNDDREGDGVYRRMRHKRTICKYSNWF